MPPPQTTWQLKQDIRFSWYQDNDEYLLYAEEAGEMLLLNQFAYQIVSSMQSHPEGLLLIDDFLKTQQIDHATESLRYLMQSLQKKHLVHRV